MQTQEYVSLLLSRVRAGDAGAWSQLLDCVHDQLHRIAAHHMRAERPDHTLQATALVNECYLRMVNSDSRSFENRAHFFAVAARLMRQILVDHARLRHAQKRGAQPQRIELDRIAFISDEKSEEVLALDQALNSLAAIDGRKAQVVEMRYFAGMTAEETAEALATTVRTVSRDWSFAKAWLRRELEARRPSG